MMQLRCVAGGGSGRGRLSLPKLAGRAPPPPKILTTRIRTKLRHTQYAVDVPNRGTLHKKEG